MRDFFVPKDLLLFSNSMGVNSDFSVRGFNTGVGEAVATLTVTVTAPTPRVIEFLGSASGVGTTSQYTVDFPVVLEPGDCVLVINGVTRGIYAATMPLTPGYTPITSLQCTLAMYRTYSTASYKIMGSTPDTSILMPGNGESTCTPAGTVVYLLRNVDPNNPIDLFATAVAQVVSNQPDPPAITPNAAGAFLVFGSVWTRQPIVNTAVPSGCTNLRRAVSNPCGQQGINVVAYSCMWEGGTVNPPAHVEQAGGDRLDRNTWCSYSIALRPAP